MPTFYAPMEGYSGSKIGETYFTTTGSPTYSSTYAQYGTTSGVFSVNQQIARSVGGATIWMQGYTKITAIAGGAAFWLGAIAPYSIQGLVVRANAGGTAVTFAHAFAFYDVSYNSASVTTHPVGAGAAWFRWQYRNGPSSSTYNIFTGGNINGATANITATTSAANFYGTGGGQASVPNSYLNATTFTAYYDNVVVSTEEPPVADPSFIPHSSVGMINAI
jgi:hypothetical protein